MSSAVLPSTTPVAVGGKDMLRQFAVIFVTILTITVNALANILPINGLETGVISDNFPVLFTPAGYVFSIWGLIYTGLIAYTIYQALPSQRANPRLRAIGWLYVASGLANSLWIFLWHYLQFGWSVLVIAVVLVSLVLIYARLYPARQSVSRGELWTTHIPFSIYLGWLTVATVANTAVWLYDLGWSGAPLTPALWTVTMLAVATVLGLFFGLRLHDAAYVLVLAWAFAGIWVKQSATPVVAWTAAGLAVAMAVVAVVALVQNRRAQRVPA
jgi:benzodiazapine receptor